MAKDRITKLYEGLTAREKAAVAFSSLARLDQAEADRIEATVERKTYRMLDAAYSDRLEHLMVMVLLWGLRHWHEFAKFSSALGLMKLARDGGKYELADEACETFLGAHARLLALDEILNTICDANGLDVESVRMLAEVGGPHFAIGDLTPDASYVEEFGELLSKLAR
jgi:hypothetical protein